jgi:hypothetical protein
MGSASAPFGFYVITRSPVPVLWAPDPATLEPDAGRTFLVYYRDPKLHTQRQAELFDRYFEGMVARLGQPRLSEYPISQPDSRYAPPTILVAQFAANASAARTIPPP